MLPELPEFKKHIKMSTTYQDIKYDRTVEYRKGSKCRKQIGLELIHMTDSLNNKGEGPVVLITPTHKNGAGAISLEIPLENIPELMAFLATLQVKKYYKIVGTCVLEDGTTRPVNSFIFDTYKEALSHVQKKFTHDTLSAPIFGGCQGKEVKAYVNYEQWCGAKRLSWTEKIHSK
jgi:hypothetical protein